MKGPKSKVAVLMPAWNASRYIGEAIGSILAQREAATFDIVVVDDGSTDATRKIVEEIARHAPEVRLIARARRGLPFARNAALDALAPDTDIVTFLDADDLSPPGRFARDLPAIADDATADVHWGMTQPFADGRIAEASRAPERGSQLGAVMLKAGAFARVGRFSEALPLAEDVDFLLRLLETRPRLALTDEVVVRYREHATNVSRDSRLARRMLTRVYLTAAHRRLHGAGPVPTGLFRPRARGAK